MNITENEILAQYYNGNIIQASEDIIQSFNEACKYVKDIKLQKVLPQSILVINKTFANK